MKSDTFYGEFMVKLIWRLSGNLIYHVLSMNTTRQFQTNFTIKSLSKISLFALLHTISISTILVIIFNKSSQ